MAILRGASEIPLTPGHHELISGFSCLMDNMTQNMPGNRNYFRRNYERQSAALIESQPILFPRRQGENMKETGKRDLKSPASLNIVIKDGNGRIWGTVTAKTKQFFSGSIGFQAKGRIENPESNELYRVGGNIILLGGGSC